MAGFSAVGGTHEGQCGDAKASVQGHACSALSHCRSAPCPVRESGHLAFLTVLVSSAAKEGQSQRLWNLQGALPSPQKCCSAFLLCILCLHKPQACSVFRLRGNICPSLPANRCDSEGGFGPVCVCWMLSCHRPWLKDPH